MRKFIKIASILLVCSSAIAQAQPPTSNDWANVVLPWLTATNETRMLIHTNVNNQFTGTLSGNGAGVSNVWVKQTFSGRVASGSTVAAARFNAFIGTATAQSTAAPADDLCPCAGGILTNLVVKTTVQMAATTNIIFMIQTNAVNGTPADSLMTCTLDGGTGVVWTNTGTLSQSITTNNAATWLIKYTASAVVPNTVVEWRIDCLTQQRIAGQ